MLHTAQAERFESIVPDGLAGKSKDLIISIPATPDHASPSEHKHHIPRPRTPYLTLIWR